MWTWVRTESQGDYTFAIIDDHPNAWFGRVLEHRAVMENVLGRILTSNEVVHHLNHDKKDNRPENLEVMTRGEHTRLHHPPAPPIVVGCEQCGVLVQRQPRQLNGKRTFCSRSCNASYYGSRRVKKAGEVPEHGTQGRYRKGCRCVACRGGQAERVRKWRKTQRDVVQSGSTSVWGTEGRGFKSLHPD